MPITLTQLGSFLAVVRSGSITAAAEQLAVTQPSVSAALSALVVAMTVPASAASRAWAAAIAGIVVVRHRSNLLRWWSARREGGPR